MLYVREPKLKHVLTALLLIIANTNGKVIKCDENHLLNAKVSLEHYSYDNMKDPILVRDVINKTLSDYVLMYITGEKIDEICANSFGSLLNNVKALQLKSNGIKTLEPDAFAFESSIIYIVDLSDNNIQRIRNGVFNNLNIVELRLNDNAISEIDDNAFGNMPRLTNINLDNNNLVTYGSDWFLHSNHLTELILSRNKITAIGRGAFKALNGPKSELLSIDLSNNELISIHPNAFEGLEKRLRINVRHNKLISVDRKIFEGIGGEPIMYLEGNNITNFEDYPSKMFNFEE